MTTHQIIGDIRRQAAVIAETVLVLAAMRNWNRKKAELIEQVRIGFNRVRVRAINPLSSAFGYPAPETPDRAEPSKANNPSAVIDELFSLSERILYDITSLPGEGNHLDDDQFKVIDEATELLYAWRMEELGELKAGFE